MVEISVKGDRLHVEMEGWHKLWAFRSELELPLAHVTSVRQDSGPALGWWHGVRLPGTNIPGVITAGTFYQHDGAVFYDIQDPEKTIVLELEHEHYKRLVVEVADPAKTVAMLQEAIHAARAS